MKKKTICSIIIVLIVVVVVGVIVMLISKNSKENYTEHLPIDFNVVVVSSPSVVNEVVANTDSFKISYDSCESGSADMYVFINDESYETYTIVANSSKTNEHIIACNKGDSIKVTVTPTMGYTSAKGSYTIDY